MKKLKCESCGANLKIDESGEYAYCEYCDLKYKLNEDINYKFSLDDDSKEVLKKGGRFLKHIGVSYFITKGIVLTIIVSVFIFIFFMAGRLIYSEIKDNNNHVSEFELTSFNSEYEAYVGTKRLFFVKHLLDDVSTNNKKNSRIISVTYNGSVITSSDEIVELKHSLVREEYEVSLDYDDAGFVKNVNLQDL